VFGWSREDLRLGVGRQGSDPLGFRAWANRVARDLTPGVTNFTTRVRGFALLCGGVRIASQAASTNLLTPDEAFRRFETLWVHAQTRHLLSKRTAERWPGSRTAARLQDENSLDLSIGLLASPLASGIFGSYRRGAIRLRLVQPPQRGAIRPDTARLTRSGMQLAEECLKRFWASDAGGGRNSQLLRALRTGRASSNDLSTIRVDSRPAMHESAILQKAIDNSDELVRLGLAALRRQYDIQSDMLAVLDGDGELTPFQSQARVTAQIILRLVDEIETPYRQWISGNEVSPVPDSVWADDALWTAVEARGGTDALALRRHAREQGGWDGVDNWQRQLSELRGSDPVERGYVTKDYAGASPPTFGLLAVKSLFDDGLLANGAE
jgi:hypothetical protein